MRKSWIVKLRAELQRKKEELEQRLVRIHANHRQPPETDSKERAAQLENQEVVDALGNEARVEIERISAAVSRIDNNEFGYCIECGEPIGRRRLLAYPHANKCIECASLDDDVRRLAS